LSLDDSACLLTFQSKFGPSQWLKPATIETVRALGASGVKRLDVFCPGFAVDCLETLEEIDILNRNAFLDAGGKQFGRIDCLNDDPVWLDAFAALVRARLGSPHPKVA
jgi:ferrochelatase